MQVQRYAPFKRGVMRFEDYNYNMYNPYILIDNTKGAKLQAHGYGNISKMGSETGPRLTEQQLELSVNGEYDFDLGAETAPAAEKHEGEKAEAKPAEAVPGQKAEGDGDESQEEEEGDEGDGEEFNLFFDRDEIESTTGQQHFDAFEELREFRRDCLITGQIGNKQLNKIAIEEFAPKEDELKSNMGKQKGKGKRGEKSKQGSNAGDLLEE